MKNGHHMIVWGTKEEFDQMEAYKQGGPHDTCHFHCVLLGWSGVPHNNTTDFFRLDQWFSNL